MSELLNLARMARRIGVTQEWLRDQANAGNVPCLKAGNRYIFNATVVQGFLAMKAARPLQAGAEEDPRSSNNEKGQRTQHDA